MSTQQDIYAAGSESRPPMLNKENYVPWSSRLLRHAKSRPNGKLIHNSILNGPYVRRMIPEPGDANRDDVDELNPNAMVDGNTFVNPFGTSSSNAAETSSSQNDIYAAGAESRSPMLNKENYVPWSSRLLRYAKSRPNGKLIHTSILNGPYVIRMIPKPGDANCDVNVTETFHEQTDDELSEKELKQIEADD
nr:ribonuclease H-like domain-containing protein [Tanacetum cinerariifolium]